MTEKRKPAEKKPAPVAQPKVEHKHQPDEPAQHEPIESVQDEQAPDETEPTGPAPSAEEETPAGEQFVEEPSEEVREFVRVVHLHALMRGVVFEPSQGVRLVYGYNGLSRVHPGGGFRHVHIATLDELAEMSDQVVYDAVMEAGKR